jgi:hypothetical protein
MRSGVLPKLLVTVQQSAAQPFAKGASRNAAHRKKK